jgi:hypothetical protein
MILDLASDDFTRLWELVWRANTIAGGYRPSDSDADLRSAVANLIRGGELALWRGSTFTGEEYRIPDAGIDSELSKPGNWTPPQTGTLHPWRDAGQDTRRDRRACPERR